MSRRRSLKYQATIPMSLTAMSKKRSLRFQAMIAMRQWLLRHGSKAGPCPMHWTALVADRPRGHLISQTFQGQLFPGAWISAPYLCPHKCDQIVWKIFIT
eukprot:1328381-Karenia_brevis.AAC.1